MPRELELVDAGYAMLELSGLPAQDFWLRQEVSEAFRHEAAREMGVEWRRGTLRGPADGVERVWERVKGRMLARANPAGRRAAKEAVPA